MTGHTGQIEQAFTNWLIESGVEGINGDTQKVEIYQYGEDGRGLRATTDIEDGDVICSIPLDLVLAHKSDDEEFTTQLGENLDEFTALAVKLLRERAQQERSPIHPHIQVLPTSVPSLYGGFPESCREELQGFVSDPDWEESRNRTAFEYAKIAQSPLMTGLTEDDFRWAYSVVSSRAFAGAFEAQDGAKVVWKFCAPLLDMLDHGGLCQLPGEEPVRRDNVRWGMQDVGSSTCRVQAIATQSVPKGQRLLLRYIDGFPSTHYLLHYGFVPVLDPYVEVDLFPHMFGAVNWTIARLHPEKDGMGEKERQQLAAEAHKAAREAGLKDIMAANESGGVTRDSLRKANPLAVKLKTGYPNLDHRFVEAISVLSQPLQGSARDKVKLVDLIVLERIGELLTQPGRTTLDADLQVLARHAAPADRNLYAKCLQSYRAKASALRRLQRPASRFVQDYECPISVAEEQGHLSTCKLQAMQLRADQKMVFLDNLVLATERTSESSKTPPKRKARGKAGSDSGAAKGFGAGAVKAKRKQ
ncbi:g2521 [Coccomyxa viridis]|uniref:G2521 protein n=1 Tax=Coccomyxa viridis TaxID=1274662 RepID=A0ABP1FKK9_9CHLO